MMIEPEDVTYANTSDFELKWMPNNHHMEQ